MAGRLILSANIWLSHIAIFHGCGQICKKKKYEEEWTTVLNVYWLFWGVWGVWFYLSQFKFKTFFFMLLFNIIKTSNTFMVLTYILWLRLMIIYNIDESADLNYSINHLVCKMSKKCRLQFPTVWSEFKLSTLTSEKLESMNVWYFCMKT